MTTAVERLIKLLDNREEMDVTVLFLQSALKKRMNSKALGKHDQREEQWKVLRWANVIA